MTDQALLDRLRTMLAARAVTEQRMFGGVCFMLSGNMLAAVSKRGLLLRVGKEAYGAALAEPHVRPMDMRGKPMAGYVYVEPAGTALDADLRRWLDLALSFVETLPPKQNKPAAR
jgi:TfoX/Sxy family transcriptional regulator of competence genes